MTRHVCRPPDDGSLIAVDPVYGCRLWQGRRDKDGYGVDGLERVHRKAWEEAHGPIPKGKELEHLCRRRACLALPHLMLVSRRDNERLKSWRSRVKLTSCPKGHDMFVNGIVTPEGGRVCRKCSLA